LKVLIAGLIPSDAGKTVLAASLVKALLREGISATPVKPLGATDLWGHPEALNRSREARLVVTWDGYILHRASGGRLPIEVINPIGALLAPTPPSRYRSRSSYEASLVEPYRRAVLTRVTGCAGGSRSLHLANADAMSRVPQQVSEALQEVIMYLTPPPTPASDEAIAGIFSGAGSTAADTCLAMAEASSDAVIVESNSDVVAPTPSSSYPSLAIMVAPGEAYLVEGTRLSRALEAIAMSGRPWAAKAMEALELTGHLGRVDLPLLEDPDEGYPPDMISPLVEAVKGRLRKG